MIEKAIESAFPQLQGSDWRVSSKADDQYNCIAWAAKVTTNWWWPVGSEKTYWPKDAPREVTLEAFQKAFASLGYIVCEGAELEAGFEKIALFANDQGVPKHAARQLADGSWTSKLGKLEDIEHPLQHLTGSLYGSIALIMKRNAKPESEHGA